MIITVDIPKELNGHLERTKSSTGLSKSYIVRSILQQHFNGKQPLLIGSALKVAR